MSKIERAFYKPERKEVTVSEFQTILEMFPHRKNLILSNLICIECGDPIVYCHGDVNEPYFKHNPSRFGGNHVNCKLFTQSVMIPSNEASIRTIFVEDLDLSLNFELELIGKTWTSLICLPPFFSEEKLEEYGSKKTTISISTNNRYRVCQIPLDNEHFSTKEIKKIGFQDFPEDIFINITSNNSFGGVYYHVDGFSPNLQLYKTLLNEDFDTTIRKQLIYQVDLISIVKE